MTTTTLQIAYFKSARGDRGRLEGPERLREPAAGRRGAPVTTSDAAPLQARLESADDHGRVPRLDRAYAGDRRAGRGDQHQHSVHRKQRARRLVRRLRPAGVPTPGRRSMLLEPTVAVARKADRRLLMPWSHRSVAAGEAFAKRLGARWGTTNSISRLETSRSGPRIDGYVA